MLTTLDPSELADAEVSLQADATTPEPEHLDDSSRGISEIVRYCRTLADALNAAEFSLLYCLPAGEGRRLAPVCDTTFPGVSLLSRQLSGKTAEGFTTSLALQPTPAWWRLASASHFLTPGARRWAREVESLPGLSSGIAFPVAVERGRSGMIVFAGDEMTIDEGALCETHARCHKAFGDLGLLRARVTVTPSISRRELECLRLTSNGHTSEEIAVALGLSVHTANQYLTNSTHKLNAVNRIHAVAKALRSGLID